MAKSLLYGALEEEDWGRLKMGRFSESDERMMRGLVERGSGLSSFRKLLGFGVDVTRPGYYSTRPRMGENGTTFSFSQKWATRRCVRPLRTDRVYVEMPGAGRSAAAAMKAAGAKWDRNVRGPKGGSGAWYVAEGTTLPKGAVFATGVAPRAIGLKAGATAEYQRYIEREAAAEFSVGNIGEDRATRAAFWGAVEEAERFGGRTQARIIVELPYEPAVGDEGRRRIVDEFCDVFRDRDLPHFAAIHRPEAHHDARNWHAHIVYFDRPILRIDGGRLVLAPTKSKEVRARDFVGQLRARFAEVVNRAYERAGLKRRFDPRSYAEAGVAKRPTVHLGSRAMGLERRGIATRRGAIAVGAERLAKVSAAAAPLARHADADRRVVVEAAAEASATAGDASAVRAAAAGVLEAGTRYIAAGESVRGAMAQRLVATWAVRDVPRRAERAARAGEDVISALATTVAAEARAAATERLRQATAAERERRRRYDEAGIALERARRRLRAELLLGEWREARAGERGAEAALELDGRMTIEEWQRRGAALEEERRLRSRQLYDQRQAVAAALRQALGEGSHVEEILAGVADARQRRRIVRRLRAEIEKGGEDAATLRRLHEAVHGYGATARALIAIDSTRRRRAGADADPAVLAQEVMPPDVRTRLEGALEAARREVAAVEARIRDVPEAAALVARRGLLAPQKDRRAGRAGERRDLR